MVDFNVTLYLQTGVCFAKTPFIFGMLSSLGPVPEIYVPDKIGEKVQQNGVRLTSLNVNRFFYPVKKRALPSKFFLDILIDTSFQSLETGTQFYFHIFNVLASYQMHTSGKQSTVFLLIGFNGTNDLFSPPYPGYLR